MTYNGDDIFLFVVIPTYKSTSCEHNLVKYGDIKYVSIGLVNDFVDLYTLVINPL